MNPLLFGGRHTPSGEGKETESVWSFLFTSNPWKSISAHPFVTNDCDSGEQNASAVGPSGPASAAFWETVRPAAPDAVH